MNEDQKRTLIKLCRHYLLEVRRPERDMVPGHSAAFLLTDPETGIVEERHLWAITRAIKLSGVKLLDIKTCR